MLNWAIRYVGAAELVRRWQPLTVLDVGSGNHGLSEYWSDGVVIKTDLAPPLAKTSAPFVVADAASLPFRDGAVDLVLSLDLLEHLAPKHRGAAIAEMCRVGRDRVLLGCPLGSVARRSDSALRRMLEIADRDPPSWLVEHASHPYPEIADIASAVPAGWSILRRVRNANVAVHTVALLADLAGATAGPAGRLGVRLASHGRIRLLDAPPTYRWLFVLHRDADPVQGTNPATHCTVTR